MKPQGEQERGNECVNQSKSEGNSITKRGERGEVRVKVRAERGEREELRGEKEESREGRGELKVGEVK